MESSTSFRLPGSFLFPFRFWNGHLLGMTGVGAALHGVEAFSLHILRPGFVFSYIIFRPRHLP